MNISTEAVDHHRKAAEHFDDAARHHTEAATLTARVDTIRRRVKRISRTVTTCMPATTPPKRRDRMPGTSGRSKSEDTAAVRQEAANGGVPVMISGALEAPAAIRAFG
jgi:hypothetical protein